MLATLGDVSPDTAATRRLKAASRAAANARRYGTPTDAAAARRALTTASRTRTREVTAIQEQEAAPGFLAQLQSNLQALGGKLALGALVLGALYVVVNRAKR